MLFLDIRLDKMPFFKNFNVYFNIGKIYTCIDFQHVNQLRLKYVISRSFQKDVTLVIEKNKKIHVKANVTKTSLYRSWKKIFY